MSPDSRQAFCSHMCAAEFRHSKKAPTTPKELKKGPLLKNSDNPRYRQDNNGQWWYHPGGKKDHGRTRAYIGDCERCGAKYVSNIFHKKQKKHCSRSCALKAANEVNPGHFLGGKPGTNWKGGKIKGRGGYIWVWNPDAAQRHRPGTKKRYVLEHRLVMEETLGRPLQKNEQVHHKNGIRDDNRAENLELWVKQQPPGQRVQDLITYAHWVLETYKMFDTRKDHNHA